MIHNTSQQLSLLGHRKSTTPMRKMPQGGKLQPMAGTKSSLGSHKGRPPVSPGRNFDFSYNTIAHSKDEDYISQNDTQMDQFRTSNHSQFVVKHDPMSGSAFNSFHKDTEE